MSTKKRIIAPSILSADFGNLATEIKAIETAGAEYVHCDVMDVHFVPNITFGPCVIEGARKATKLPLDVHLMISNPEKYIPQFRKAGADILTVHAEACGDNLEKVIDQIQESGAKVGVCVNPDKPIDLFLPFLEKIDMVLIMSVYAGFGGQKFIPEMLKKIENTKEAIVKKGLDIDIEIDGGINDKTIKDVYSAGANIIVAGSYVFNSDNYKDRIDTLLNA